MVYLIENADEVGEKFRQAKDEYPPWQSTPQASSSAVHDGASAAGPSEAGVQAASANLLVSFGLPPFPIAKREPSRRVNRAAKLTLTIRYRRR
jgi:hypothetical protein